ncbi:MAG: PQQ-dependent sugar dehydrogenase [Armatimonadetes bacterium]|nr:PQQ-dependent sugar dehydrogenase [Armatimonadota bacterium]
MSRTLALAFVASALPSLAGAQLRVSTWSVGSLVQPVAVVQHPTDPHVQFIVQQTGAILVAVDGNVLTTPFLTLSVLNGSERGLLGLCFDPDYATNGYFYVNYTRPGVYMQLSRFSRDPIDPLKGDPTSEAKILRTQRPFSNHNSGTVMFGPDRMLYLPTGDGGSGGDPANRAQNPNELLGKMLRIDPRSDDFPGDPEANYHVPPDNPFLDSDPITARGEIWAFGLRNPWKFSFDDPKWLGTGAMLLPDVGQGAWEEFNYEPAGKGGRNYGWSRFEGFAIYDGSRNLAYQPHTTPVHAYGHGLGIAITGGYVYRGLELGPEFFGRYFFADYGTGRLWSAGLVLDGAGEATLGDVKEHTSELGASIGNPSSIDVDETGELYLCDVGSNRVLKLYRADSAWLTDVSRADGLITDGQVRSLVAADGKTLRIVPFSPVQSPTKKTTTVVGFKTNKTGAASFVLDIEARMSQNLNVPTVVKVKNWTSGDYDTVDSFSLNGTMSLHTSTFASADHVRASDQRIEIRIETSYTGPVLAAALATLIERATCTPH